MSTIRADNIVSSGGANTATINGITPALASQAQAEAGTDNATLMTPLRVRQARAIRGTAVPSTSGTAIDFTDIPSWAKRVTVMLSGVSLTSTQSIEIRVGTTSGVENTGYVSGAGDVTGTAVSLEESTTGFALGGSSAGDLTTSAITLLNVTGNLWIASGTYYNSGTSSDMGYVSGTKTLSGVLDRVRITTVSGSGVFDAGTVNIMWE
jgi:hypothetical protein